MVEHLQDLQLSVLVALILEHLLDSDSLASFCNCGLENDAKGPISNDLLSVISEALLLQQETSETRLDHGHVAG